MKAFLATIGNTYVAFFATNKQKAVDHANRIATQEEDSVGSVTMVKKDTVRPQTVGQLVCDKSELFVVAKPKVKRPKCQYCACTVRNHDADGMENEVEALCRKCQKELGF